VTAGRPPPTAKDTSLTNQDGRWFEAIPPADLRPQDLYQAQLKRRLAEKPAK